MSVPPSPPPYTPPSAPVSPPTGNIPNYFVWSIIATVFATIFTMLTCCCLPLGLAPGIPAIMFANKANRMATFDDPAAARDAADKAKLWTWVTTGVAIAFALLFGLSLMANLMGWTDAGNLKDLIEELEKQQR